MSHGINITEAGRPLLRIPGMGYVPGPPTDAELGLVAVEAECGTDYCAHPIEDHPTGPCDWCECTGYREDY